MITIYEWLLSELDGRFDSVAEEKDWLKGLWDKIQEDPIHNGDCTHRNTTCFLCIFTEILDDYYTYTKNKLYELYRGANKKNKGKEMTKEVAEYVRSKINNKGFDYAFMHYSDYNDIDDKIFHELRKKYIEVHKQLEQYVASNII